MSRLPIIVGMGGANPAGRISFNHAYRRMISSVLQDSDRQRTYKSLAALMGITDPSDEPTTRKYIDDHTLIRRIENFDPDNVRIHSRANLKSEDGESIKFRVAKRDLPESLPESWHLKNIDHDTLEVTTNSLDIFFENSRRSKVTSAGQLPTGFDPGNLYPSRNHPRGLQLAVFGASDALQSSGLSLNLLKDKIEPDQFGVYSGSAMGQLDLEGFAGMFQNPLLGKRPTSKHAALGLPEMPGDFINAYVLGLVGDTAGVIGACATFLYNVKRGADEIAQGRKKLVIAGNAEAPIIPDVMEAYRVMGALAEDEDLKALDNHTEKVDNRRACRPFSSNCGFTIGESSVYVILMDDELAIELGAQPLSSVGGVFVNADGYKKSIPGPGIGNYITAAKAMSLAKSVIGEKALKTRTHMLAHGTGTPQNRVTESEILNRLAKLYGINDWPIAAIKAYVGHSMAPAGGDQLAAAIGVWEHGWLPGITTIDHIAPDVEDSNLHFPMKHLELGHANVDAAFINSKGFGGNNATGLFLSPSITEQMLKKKWGTKTFNSYKEKCQKNMETAYEYDNLMNSGLGKVTYQFGTGVLEGDDLEISKNEIKIPGFGKSISLETENPYADMIDNND